MQVEATEGLHDLITQGVHPQLRGVVTSMRSQPKLAQLSALNWLEKILSRKEFGTAYRGLDTQIRDNAKLVLAAVRFVFLPEIVYDSALIDDTVTHCKAK